MSARIDSLPAVAAERWPALPYDEWKATYATLHMWTQIVGHIRMALTPKLNHFWNVTLYVTPRGLTTSAIPYGDGIFEIEFDFIGHELLIKTSNGAVRKLALRPCAVADFYQELMALLHSLGIDPHFHGAPDEVPDPIAFARDRVHVAYEPQQANRCWRILVATEQVLSAFRAGFIGKCSPVHFFWGSFDLAVTRFSGRRAPPPRKGADTITREAYSHEVSSAGFWPGSGEVKAPAFYSYAAPEPAGFRESRILPAKAFYDTKLGEFLLMYDDVRAASEPETLLMQFLQSTYAACANLGKWDRDGLETRVPQQNSGGSQ